MFLGLPQHLSVGELGGKIWYEMDDQKEFFDQVMAIQ